VVGGWDFAENDAIPYDAMRPPAFTARTWPHRRREQHHVSGASHRASIWFRCACSTSNGSGQFAWIEQALQWVVQHRNDYAHPITTVNSVDRMNGIPTACRAGPISR